MSSISYKEIIHDTIIHLGGKASLFQIYDFIEKNYSNFIEGKKEKAWKGSIRYTLCRGDFHQKDKVKYSRGHKYWYNDSFIKNPTQGETLQKEFEEALKWIQSDKKYQEKMLDNYLEI